MTKKTSTFLGLLFLFVVIAGGTWAGLAIFAADDSEAGDIRAFCSIQNNADPEDSETNDGLLTYYTGLLQVAPEEIRSELVILQNSEKIVGEIYESGDIAALFAKNYQDIEANEARTQLDDYFSLWC